MAELTHFYDDDNTVGTTTSSTGAVLGARIASGVLAADTKYLIVARALFGVDDAGDKGYCRIGTDDDTSILSKSEAIVEFDQIGSGEYISYPYVHSFITDASPSAVVFNCKVDGGSTLSLDQSSMFLLDLDAISAPNLLETAYFDASDAGPTDSSANWTGDANAFDGSTSTHADSASATGNLSGEGTTAPTSGATIGLVEVRVLADVTAANSSLFISIDEDVVDGNELGLITATTSAGFKWYSGVLTAPAGGWTWQKVNDLAIKFDPSGTSGIVDIYKAEVRVYDVNGLGYVENVQPVDGGHELTLSTGGDELAGIAGSDLGTDEHLILGYARVDIGSTGRSFTCFLETALDASSNATVSSHTAEGEDTDEQRLVGFAARHQASSGTPAVSIRAYEEAANGNMTDGGGYVIALPTALFADFVDDYEAGTLAMGVGEKTLATSGSYTPTVTGNHLIFGRSNGVSEPNAFHGMWVDSTTTEIRTGDDLASVSHNQSWDSTKDNEFQATFQRYSITTAETFNLIGEASAQPVGIHHRWLIVVNLNEPAAPAGDGSLPHKPNRTMRHLLLR